MPANIQLEIILIASAVAAGCSLVGTFLVLRKMSLMSDAISHAILLGIVAMFFFVQDTGSVLLIIAAAITGVLTVVLVEAIVNTRLVKEDAAIGLVFPALFSLGVVLISRYAANVHLDTDAVLLGELAFAPFDRLLVGGQDLGPKALWLAIGVGLVNLIFVLLFYKELKLATFDPGLAAALGFSPTLIHYALMTLVSITAVSSFEAVGSVLVVALMIGPPAAAYLLTDRLGVLLGLGVAIGVLSAAGGYGIAHALDASIAGSMATMVGLLFVLALLFAPTRGLVAIARRRARQRWEFALKMLVIHLLNHEGLPEAEEESCFDHLHEEIQWEPNFAGQLVKRAERLGLITEDDGCLALTEQGRSLAREAVVG
jgi:manganese/zinc/iron transport system permease protein